MRVIMFQDRFVSKIKDGTKIHTIRKSDRVTGMSYSLRRWTGKPYRSKQERILEVVCAGTCLVSIGHGENQDKINLEGVEMSTIQREVIARDDGFQSAEEMLKWFQDNHGLPFEGWLIEWKALEQKEKVS